MASPKFDIPNVVAFDELLPITSLFFLLFSIFVISKTSQPKMILFWLYLKNQVTKIITNGAKFHLLSFINYH